MSTSAIRWSDAALWIAPVAAALVYFALPTAYPAADGTPAALTPAARGSIAMAVWMAVWWLTEAVPVAATALLPLALFAPFGLAPPAALAGAYGHPLIFLFLGGFLLSLAIEKWRIHAWIAGRVVAAAATSERRLVGAFMLVTAVLSMWLSNTATTIMMLPIASSLITLGAADGGSRNFAPCVLLGVAYAASIGGMATLIGSPPNLFVASYLETALGVRITFAEWMVMALPLSAVLLPLTWWFLTRWWLPVDATRGPRADHLEVSRFSALPRAAHRVAAVFACTVLAWLLRAPLNALSVGDSRPFELLSDTAIAIAAGIALFAIPVGDAGTLQPDQRADRRLLVWQDTSRLPYGTLLLFGGGLALGSTLRTTGADVFIGAQLAQLASAPQPLVVLAVIALVVFLTELTSNTATTSTLAPILAATATVIGLQPDTLLVVTALAAACAFMMPVATPPNAIVYASGHIAMRVMAGAGIWLNVLAIGVLFIAAHTWLPWIRGASG